MADDFLKGIKILLKVAQEAQAKTEENSGDWQAYNNIGFLFENALNDLEEPDHLRNMDELDNDLPFFIDALNLEDTPASPEFSYSKTPSKASQTPEKAMYDFNEGEAPPFLPQGDAKTLLLQHAKQGVFNKNLMFSKITSDYIADYEANLEQRLKTKTEALALKTAAYHQMEAKKNTTDAQRQERVDELLKMQDEVDTLQTIQKEIGILEKGIQLIQAAETRPEYAEFKAFLDNPSHFMRNKEKTKENNKMIISAINKHYNSKNENKALRKRDVTFFEGIIDFAKTLNEEYKAFSTTELIKQYEKTVDRIVPPTVKNALFAIETGLEGERNQAKMGSSLLISSAPRSSTSTSPSASTSSSPSESPTSESPTPPSSSSSRKGR